MTVKFTNNASSSVATGINTSATSLTVADASTFPSLSGADDYCYLTIQQATGSTREVVKATALSSNTFTIVRAQDNTTAGTWSSGDVVELRLTAALLQDVIDQATVEGIKTNFQYIPTANQTQFSGADNSGDTMIINDAELVNVYMNGVRLVQGSDYTVSSSNNRITLSTGATTADVIDIEVFGNFTGQSGAAVAITGGAIAGTAITGGSINNTPVGATQANTVAATTLTANTLTTTGKVGLGLSNPSSYYSKNLVVSADGDGTGGITIAAPATDDTTYLAFADGTSGAATYAGYVGYAHNGDDLFLGAGGATRVTIDSSGATFSGSVTASGLTVNGGTSNVATTFKSTDATVGIKLEDDTGNVELSALGNVFSVQPGGGSAILTALSTGVGIGTSSITSGFKLEVTGDARFGDAVGDDAVELGWSSGGSQGFIQAYDRGASAFRNLIINNALTLNSDGTATFGGSVSVTGSGNTALSINTGNNSGDNSQIKFGDSADDDVGQINYDHGTNALQFRTNGGANALVIGNTGGASFANQVLATMVNNIDHGLMVAASGADSASSRLRLTNNGSDVAFGRNAGSYPGAWVKADNSVASGVWIIGASGATSFYQSAAGDTTPLSSSRFLIDASGNTTFGGNVNIAGGNLDVGTDSATVNFTDSNSGYTKYIEIGSTGATGNGDALLVVHAPGKGVGYFGYEAANDRLIIATDNGGGNNSIEFSVNAGTTTGGGTDNLNGATSALTINGSGETIVTGPNSATMELRAPTDNAFLMISAGYNDSGAEYAGLVLRQNQTNKWQISNTDSNIFRIYSYAVTAPVLQIDTYGVTSLGDGGGHSDLLRLKNSYSSDNSQRGAISWEDSSATTAQIDTRYDGSRVNMHFSHLYKNGYQTGNAAILGGLGTWGVHTNSPRTDIVFTSGTAVHSNRWGFGGGISGTNNVFYVINENNAGVYIAHGNQSWTAHSDERIKENIVDVGTVLPSLMGMRCVKYNLVSNPDSTKIGFIAQDWESSFPEVVDENDHLVLEDDGTIGTNDESDSTTPVKAMAYTETIPLLLKAIQELSAKVDEQAAKITALETN